MSENVIEHYLTDMAEIHATRANAPETSFYPALEKLLSNIGKGLKPKVRCIVNLANRGAGLPDVTEMTRRITALIALQPELDDNYRAVIKETYPWPKK